MRTVLPCLALLLAATVAPAAEKPRNVLLLVADDLGCDLGCYGNGKVKTPNLDALATRSVRFSHAFATVASCSASRAVIYTGQYTHANGQYGHAHAVHNLHTFANVPSLPKVLKTNGYRTGILGKLHVQPASVYPFDADMQAIPGSNHNVAAVAKKAGEFFRADEKPFLLVVGYGDTHRTGKGFGNERKYEGVPEVKYEPKDVTLPYFLPDLPEARTEMAEYYQAVSRLDHGIGLMLDALKESGKADSTLVIFLSDNGIPFPGAKTTQYDAGLRLPLLIHSPDQKRRGLVSKAMASWVDIAPTALDWAVVKAPAAMQGRSLLPILEDEDPKGWDEVCGSHVFHEITMYYPVRTIRTREYKYMVNLAHGVGFPFASDLYESRTWQALLKSGGTMMGKRSVASYINRPREELYDLRSDPDELKNLASDAASAVVLKDLRGRLRAWQEKTKDPWVVKYTHE
jgi:N-sulfoglucosamine sulfohydrolase